MFLRSDCSSLADVCAILQQALDRSPAYESIRNVLESLNVDEVLRLVSRIIGG